MESIQANIFPRCYKNYICNLILQAYAKWLSMIVCVYTHNYDTIITGVWGVHLLGISMFNVDRIQ